MSELRRRASLVPRGLFRYRWVAAGLVVVVVATAAVPAVRAADSGAPGQRENAIELSDELKRNPPSASARGREQLTAAAEEKKRDEERRKADLASPEARDARRESQTAFEETSGPAARDLFRKHFGEQVAAVSVDAADLARGGRMVGFLDDFTMRVDHGGERGRELVFSPNALRIRDDDSGKSEPTDLTLEPKGGALEPANGAADVALPVRLEQGAKVGEVRIYPEVGVRGAAEAQALSGAARFTPTR